MPLRASGMQSTAPPPYPVALGVGIIEPPRRQDAKEEREKGREINSKQLTRFDLIISISLPGWAINLRSSGQFLGQYFYHN
jgi:hypothetical protein